MEALEIFKRLSRKAEIINANARPFGFDVGFAVPVQSEVTDEVLTEVDKMLTEVGWTFVREKLGYKGQFYVLFPFG